MKVGVRNEDKSRWERRVPLVPADLIALRDAGIDAVLATQQEVRRVLAVAVREPVVDARWDEAIDRVVLHPVWGMLILAVTLFLMFQAVFSWAAAPMDAIKSAVEAVGELVRRWAPRFDWAGLAEPIGTYAHTFAQFRPLVGVRERLPGARTAVDNLILAGDLTTHPSLEGAVASGVRAAGIVDALTP